MGLELLRGFVFGLCLICALIAFGSWAVMTRRINPFSRLGQIIRKATDPVLGPVEHWVRRRGGNPRNAGWWILGAAIVGGILLITVGEWLVVESARFRFAASSGPRGVLRLVVRYAGRILMIALMARVIGSWFGVGRFNRWMRPAYILTDWLVEPLRKVVPPVRMIDITPLVAYLIIWLGTGLVLSFI